MGRLARLGVAIGSGGIGGEGSDGAASRVRIEKCVAAMVLLSEIRFGGEDNIGD